MVEVKNLTADNGRTTLAVVKNEVMHLKENITEIKDNLKEIKCILTEGAGKIEANREAIRWTRWVLGGAVAFVGALVTALRAL